MRSMKYLPSVSTLNSIKYFRQLVNNSLQKFNTIDVNLIVEKYINNIKSNNGNESLNNADERTQTKSIEKSFDDKVIELTSKSKTAIDQSIADENRLFESALNEWIQSKDPLNGVRGQSVDKGVVTDGRERRVPAVTTTTAPAVGLPSVVSRSGLELRTKQLLQSMSGTDSAVNTRRRLQELSKLLVSYPESIGYAVSQKAVQRVLRVSQSTVDRTVRSQSLQVLAQLGHSGPPKGTGIRILSIDGGGTRGVLVIEILRELERLSGRPVHQMFDLICGVSTGAIIGMLLGALQTSIDECEEYYHRFSSLMFKSDFFRGAGRLLWSHAYYDTSVWEKILKEVYSETYLVDTKQSAATPHILAISAVMNRPSIQAFLFRNYELPVHSRALSQYEGSSKYKIWEAVRASAAAPGYFEEFRLDKCVHQDGGILINNPTAVAIHEAKLLWPNESIQCVLSLGSGRYIPPRDLKAEEGPVVATSLKTKLIRLIDSATDTEMVHRLMKDLLPKNTYFRINPFLTEIGTIDENRPEKLEQMKADARLYLRKNELKVNETIKQLVKSRKIAQKIDDWFRLQYQMRV